MDLLHTFRLQGPWNYRFYPLGNLEQVNFNDPVDQRISLPASWQDLRQLQPGVMSFKRRFNNVMPLAPGNRLIITLQDINATAKLFCLHECSRINSDQSHWSFLLPETLPTSVEFKILIAPDSHTDWQQPVGLWKPVLLQIVNLD